MQPVSQALDEIKALYQKVLGQPAPEIAPGSYAAFPPGVDPIGHAIREVEQIKQFSEQMRHAPRLVAWVPPADSFVTPDAFVVRLDIAGADRDKLEVFVAGGECVVRGERKVAEVSPDARPLGLERPWGAFERRFPMPAGSVADGVSARYEEGVLELKIAAGNGQRQETSVEVA
jgi:HSP20 family molecular chaperone IbpA